MNHLVLYSGGPDSFITLHKVLSEERDPTKVDSIYFNLGHKYKECELRALRETSPDTRIVHALEGLGEWEEPDATIWYRNAFLCLAAAKYVTGKTTIYLTVQKDELSIPDRKPEFLFGMENLLNTLGQDIRVAAPFLNMDKIDMFRWYLKNGGTAFKLKKTWSCYHPRMTTSLYYQHCGNCPACIRRYIAFTLSDVHTNLNDFYVEPRSSKVARDYVKAAIEGKYSPDRTKRILSALG
jgi:7-cyano-7-deazaguanine synthase in queuosine biosynthesis